MYLRLIYFITFLFVKYFIGFHHSAGLFDLKDNIAAEDAPPVKLLRNAGAILLGTTNVSEFCMWYESYNQVYGRTSNPYATTRGPGGSSGRFFCTQKNVTFFPQKHSKLD